MDSNQPTPPPSPILPPQPQPAATPNPNTAPPVAQAINTEMPAKNGGSNMKFIVLGILIILIIVVGVIYFIMLPKSSTDSGSTISDQSSAQEVNTLGTSLKTEVDSMDLGDPDKDVSSVDSDIQGL